MKDYYYVGYKTDLTLFVAAPNGDIVADNVSSLTIAEVIAKALNEASDEGRLKAND